MNKHYPPLIILSIALLFRLILLDRIPIGITNDELEFVINAKSFFLTGQTFSSPRAELTHVIISPIIGPLSFSFLAARLPYVTVSVLTVILLFLITKKLIGEREAFFVGLAGALNPWSIFFARTSYEAPVSIFFYVLTLYVLVIAKKWKIILAIIPLTLAFFTYAGTKLIFLPFITVSVFYAWKLINKSMYLKQYLMLLLLCTILFSVFTLNFIVSGNQRIREVGPNISKVSEQVDTERRLTINSPLSTLFSNKAIILMKNYISKYLDAFSPNLLFLHGDREGGQKFSLWFHGHFYYLDILLIVFGFSFLVLKNVPLLALLSSLIFIAPIPSTLREGLPVYSLQSALIFPVTTIFAGLGIFYALFLKKSKIYFRSVSVLVLIIYSFQILNFINVYFFRHPIYNSEGFNFSSRNLSKYIAINTANNKKITIISPEADSLFKDYLFYTNSLNRQNASKILDSYKQKRLEYGHVRFTNCPENIDIFKDNVLIVSVDSNCQIIAQPHLTIPKLDDGGAIYKVYNDDVCNKYLLNSYPSNFSLSDFKLEKFSEKRFCEKFITK